MKKVMLSIMMIFFAVLMTSQLFAAEAETVEVHVHYQNWDGEYDTLGSHAWGGPAAAQATFDETDEFGVVFEYKNIPVGTELGFIAVHWENGAQNWDKKETGDVKIDTTGLTAGQTHHVYVFQGAETKTNHPGYFIARNDRYNLILVYADPAGTYEENLGVHAWNTGAFSVSGWDKWNEADPVVGEWGNPTKIFTNGATHSAVGNVKVALLSTDNLDMGMLIYAGGDPDKKTGDVTLKAAVGEDAVLGAVGVTYVYSKGNAYTANDNVLPNNKDEFVQEAFSFKLLPIGRDDSGLLTGTHAPIPNQLIVKLSSQVALPEGETAAATIKGWFKVFEVTIGEENAITRGNQLTITEVQHAPGEAAGDFVVLLGSNFDITKDYLVAFDLGLQGDDNKAAELLIDLDRQAPSLEFVAPLGIIDKAPENRIIEVPWNQKFNFNLFPKFIVTDDRDGDITTLVYVPADKFNTINTNVEGDYKIMLRVEDTWGNVTEETFIFRVKK